MGPSAWPMDPFCAHGPNWAHAFFKNILFVMLCLIYFVFLFSSISAVWGPGLGLGDALDPLTYISLRECIYVFGPSVGH